MHVEGQESPTNNAQTSSIHLCSRTIGGGAAGAAAKSGDPVVPCYVYTQVHTYTHVHTSV